MTAPGARASCSRPARNNQLVRILIVDDDRAVREALRRALTLADYVLETAEDGEQALEQIAASPPDAVVLDVGLPGIDGLEVCRRIRLLGNRVPILMLTAKGFEMAHLEMAEKCGVLAVLPKPFSPRELVRYIDTILSVGAVPSH